MNTTDELAIELSKAKMILLLLGAIVFVAAGLWMFSLNPETIREAHKNPLFVHGVGIAAMVFFGLCVLAALRKLFDKRPGLVLNSSGIIENSSSVSAGFIPWSEIVGAEIFQVHRQKMLIIKVINPEAYIERGNALKRLANRANYKMCGSPIAITSNTLKISFPELLSIFERYHRSYAGRMGASMQ